MGLPAGGGRDRRLNAPMPHVTFVRRPRRWWRAVRVAILLMGVVLAVAFIWAPTIGVYYAAIHLPWTAIFPHGSLTVVAVKTSAALPSALSSSSSAASPSAPSPSTLLNVQMVGSSRVLRSLVSSVTASSTTSSTSSASASAISWWLPPGLLRGGQNVNGHLSLPFLRMEPFTWQVLVAGDAATPLACVQLSPVDLTQFLRTHGQTVLTFGGVPIMHCSYNVDWGHIEDDDEAEQMPLTLRLNRRFKVVARGSILLASGMQQRLVKVDRLAGHAWVTFVPVPEGYRLTMRIAIEQAEAELITLPIVGDARPMLMKQLETAANDGLIDGLENVVLPSWFPTDLRTEILIK